MHPPQTLVSFASLASPECHTELLIRSSLFTRSFDTELPSRPNYNELMVLGSDPRTFLEGILKVINWIFELIRMTPT